MPAGTLQKIGEASLRVLVPGDGEAHAAVVRVARKLVHVDSQVVGFVPATRKVGVPPLLIRLALSLCDLGSSPVVVIDANSRNPGFPSFARQAKNAEQPYLRCRVGEGVDLLTPARRSPGIEFGYLEKAIEQQRARCARVLVDLTDFDELGEHLNAYELVDGVLVVAHARRTPAQALAVRCQEVPKRLNLGVLLVER